MSNFNSEYLLVKSLSFNHFLANSFPSIVIGIQQHAIDHWYLYSPHCICKGYLYSPPKIVYGHIYRVSHIIGPTLFFFYFLGFWSTYRGTSDLFSTALEICYIIATRILKIDSEIAEIIEVKVGTCNTKIIFLTQCNSKMLISKWRMPTSMSIISAISKSIFKILGAIM